MSDTEPNLKLDWRLIQKEAGPYPLEAFTFVRDGLSFTTQQTHEDIESLGENERHITGQQLCIGLRDYAIDQYGALAPTVLDHWHIRRTDDFGRIVFAMIEAGVMTKTDSDCLEDFRAVYDFCEAFNDQDLTARIGEN